MVQHLVSCLSKSQACPESQLAFRGCGHLQNPTPFAIRSPRLSHPDVCLCVCMPLSYMQTPPCTPQRHFVRLPSGPLPSGQLWTLQPIRPRLWFLDPFAAKALELLGAFDFGVIETGLKHVLLGGGYRGGRPALRG